MKKIVIRNHVYVKVVINKWYNNNIIDIYKNVKWYKYNVKIVISIYVVKIFNNIHKRNVYKNNWMNI